MAIVLKVIFSGAVNIFEMQERLTPIPRARSERVKPRNCTAQVRVKVCVASVAATESHPSEPRIAEPRA